MRHTDLWTDSWVILADEFHPGIGGCISMADFAANPWAFTYQSHNAFTTAGQPLRSHDIEPRIEAVVQGFLAPLHRWHAQAWPRCNSP